MKLILSSGGFTTDEIIDTTIKLIGKPKDEINLAIINEGYAVEGDSKRWAIEEMAKIAKIFPGRLDLVNLLALKPEQIEKHLKNVDGIYVLGGHTDYSMHVLNQSGLAAMLPELLKTKVYIGSSAGSMIMGRRVNTEAYQLVYGEEGTYGVEEYMNLVDLAIKPHLGNPDFPNNTEGIILDVSKTWEGRLYSLKDTQAIVMVDDYISYLGGRPFGAQGGKRIET